MIDAAKRIAQHLPMFLQQPIRCAYLSHNIRRKGGTTDCEWPALRSLLTPGMVAFDIGANAGAYSLSLSAFVRDVYAFEPIKANFEVLKRVTGTLPNVHAQRCAVGDYCGVVEMSIPDGLEGYYLATMNGAPGRKETVSVVTLDSLSLPDPQFIKCDVEGHEIDVLRGAKQLIGRTHPTWFIEGHSETVFAFMRERGYSTLYYRDGAWVPYDGTRVTNYLYR